MFHFGLLCPRHLFKVSKDLKRARTYKQMMPLRRIPISPTAKILPNLLEYSIESVCMYDCQEHEGVTFQSRKVFRQHIGRTSRQYPSQQGMSGQHRADSDTTWQRRIAVCLTLARFFVLAGTVPNSVGCHCDSSKP